MVCTRIGQIVEAFGAILLAPDGGSQGHSLDRRYLREEGHSLVRKIGNIGRYDSR